MCAVLHECVEDGHCGHCFDDGYGTGYDAYVVAATDFDYCGVAAGIDGGESYGHGGYGLEGHAEDDGHTVGYASLDAAGVI